MRLDDTNTVKESEMPKKKLVKKNRALEGRG
jgi:hypothetical protein